MTNPPPAGSEAPRTEAAGQLSATHVLFALIGLALHLTMGVFVAASGLVAPPWGVAVLAAVWIATAVLSLRRWRRQMFMPLLMAAAVALAWIGLVAFGGAVLGWQA